MKSSVNSAANLRAVVLCGGAGSRLWPLSRSDSPKQFINLIGQDSLFQKSLRRLTSYEEGSSDKCNSIIVANEEHRFLVAEQLREAGLQNRLIILEPSSKNTAPALTLAALAAVEEDDPILIVTPADQIVTEESAFERAISSAAEFAAEGEIVVLGVAPDRPETGFGYIEIQRTHSESLFPMVKSFIEKPDLTRAQKYVESQDHFWNSGILILRASVWLSEIERFRPDILHSVADCWDRRQKDCDFTRPDKSTFEQIPAESIDYAVLEGYSRTDRPLRMVALDGGWSDLGSWHSVWLSSEKDKLGNAVRGDVVTSDCHNVLVQAESRLVTLFGVKNIIVVETPDAVLVIDQSQSQNVKKLVEVLKAGSRIEEANHRKVHRPWGWYDCLDEGDGFKVKLIEVKPNASLSLQKHKCRAEHWVVVKGQAEVTCGDQTVLMSANQSTYIPKGEVHRLANRNDAPLQIIEVQSGTYLGEDDIVRFDDRYGRETEK